MTDTWDAMMAAHFGAVERETKMTDKTPTDLAAALIADVPRYRLTGYDAGTQPDGAGPYVSHHEVLAALSRALDPALTERAGEMVPKLTTWEGESETLDAAADLITALLTANAALRAQVDTMIDADTVQKMLDDAQPIMAEACRGYEEANSDLQARLSAAEAKVEKLRGATRKVDAQLYQLWAEARDHRDRSALGSAEYAARERVASALRLAHLTARAALTTEEGHDG